jgi:hypothetical protein
MRTHNGSLNDQLQKLAVGQALYIESTIKDCLNIIRRVTAKTRRPDLMKNYEFSCNTFTAIGVKKLGEIKILVRVERLK